MQSLAKCEGMDIKFFCRITANSYEYARLHKDAGTGCFSGSEWINITLEEMIHFLDCFKNEH